MIAAPALRSLAERVDALAQRLERIHLDAAAALAELADLRSSLPGACASSSPTAPVGAPEPGPEAEGASSRAASSAGAAQAPRRSDSLPSPAGGARERWYSVYVAAPGQTPGVYKRYKDYARAVSSPRRYEEFARGACRLPFASSSHSQGFWSLDEAVEQYITLVGDDPTLFR